MKSKVQEIKDQLDVWAEAAKKHPYSDIRTTVQMGHLIAQIVGYISLVEDKIDNYDNKSTTT